MKTVTIYTDGACRGNPGPGGWGALLDYRGQTRSLKGGDLRAFWRAFWAAIRALQALQQPCLVHLYTDSTYLRKGITEWLPNWKRRNWRTADRKPVKNADLWQMLEAEAERHEVDWRWVKGHSGDPGNEAADLLANQGIDEMLATTQ